MSIPQCGYTLFGCQGLHIIYVFLKIHVGNLFCQHIYLNLQRYSFILQAHSFCATFPWCKIYSFYAAIVKEASNYKITVYTHVARFPCRGMNWLFSLTA